MLVSGVLYQDDSPSRNLQERVERCAALYREKRGALPVVAYVHPSELNGQERAGDVRIVGHKTVLRHHYLLSGDELESTSQIPKLRDELESTSQIEKLRDELESTLQIAKLTKLKGRDDKWRPREMSKAEEPERAAALQPALPGLGAR